MPIIFFRVAQNLLVLTTSAGLILVAFEICSAISSSSLYQTHCKTPPISPRAYDVTAENTSRPASAARLGFYK